MNADTTSGLLSLISKAVTPVVLISACATLILGVNGKHSGLADRIRAAIAEHRRTETPPARRRQIAEQIPVFHRRFLLSWVSLSLLYLAVALFVLTTIIILVTQRGLFTFDTGALVLFGLGILLVLVAMCFEIGETILATRSLEIEMRDVLAESHAVNSSSDAPPSRHP